MLPLVGIAEEAGWRGFLQPELEKKFPFPIATSITAVIWYVWHLPIWLMPSSNHYGDSLIGFAITIFVWAFVSAAIYKATKSVLACAAYYSFINSIGAIYDWNALFDAYPKSNGMLLYFGIVFALAIVIWVITDKKIQRCRLKNEEDGSLSDKALKQKIKMVDKGRARYYEFFTGNKWGDKKNYDICVNTSNLPIKLIAENLATTIQKL